MADRLDELIAGLQARQDAQAEKVRVLAALLRQAEADAKRVGGPGEIARVIAVKRMLEEAEAAMVVRVRIGTAGGSPRLTQGHVSRNSETDDWQLSKSSRR